MVDRRSGGGPEGWSEEEWPEMDWEREERRSRPVPPPAGDRTRARGTPGAGEGIDPDLSRVMDDPMFNALPGGVPLPERGRPAVRGQERFSMGRRPTGLSAGQKILLWFGFALVAGVSFATGLLVGASGDREFFPWLPGGGVRRTEAIIEKPLDSGATPDASGEGVIAFSDHGRVPPKPEEGAEPLPQEKAVPKAEAKPETAPAQTPAAEIKPVAPVPEKKAAAAARAPSDEMTFYDTATGRREVPGLAAEGSGGGDSEAAPEVPSAARADSDNAVPSGARADSDNAVNAVPSGARAGDMNAAAESAGEATVDAPLGADMLAQRRAAQAQTPGTASGEDVNAAPAEGLPSGAEILARRRAEAAARTDAAPAETPPGEASAGAPRAPSGQYTVQVATLTSSEEARGLAERLTSKGFDVRVDSLSGVGGTTLYRVRVGRYADERAAQRALDRIREEPGATPFIKAE